MTLAAALRVGLSRWPWLAGPVLVTAGLAALIGAAIKGQARYRVTRILRVTDGAPAEAIFTCRSREVLVAAMEKADLERLVPPEELARQVTLKEAGERLIHLTVERSSSEEAAALAAAIADEASRKVEVIARTVRKDAQEKRQEVERRLLQVRANRDARLAELDDLRRKYPDEIDEAGRPLGTAQKRLVSVQSALAEAKRDVAAADAELKALRARIEKTPVFMNPVDAPPSRPGHHPDNGAADPTAPRREDPLFSSVPERFRALEEEIRKLRRDLTDEHPHLARLLAERARLEAALTQAGPPVPNPLRVELERGFAETEARRSRAAAVLSRLEEEEKELEPRARESVTLGIAVRTINDKLRKHEAEIEDVGRELDQVKREALADATARAALVDLTRSEGRKPQVLMVHADAPPGTLAVFGAVLGLMFGVLLAALAESMDPVVRTEEDVARLLDMPVLAAVPAATLVRGEPRSRARALGAVVWLAAFLLAAAILILLVYPGWERLRAMFPRAGREAPTPHDIEEVLP